MVFLSLFHVKTFLKVFYAHIILQSIPSQAVTAKGSLIERRGIIIVLNVKEIAKIPQEVTEHIVDFSQCR